LLVDSYGYRYRNGAWGDADAALVLTGEERTPVPADLLAVQLPIGRRRGVDLNPVDVATDEGVRLLTNLVGCKPEEVKIGMPVEVTFEDATAEVSIPLFRPVTG